MMNRFTIAACVFTALLFIQVSASAHTYVATAPDGSTRVYANHHYYPAYVADWNYANRYWTENYYQDYVPPIELTERKAHGSVDHARLHYTKGKTFSDAARQREVIAYAEEVIRTSPRENDLWTYRAAVDILHRDFKKAQAHAARAIRVNPKNPRSQFLKGVVEDKLGNTHNAISNVSNAIVLNPQDAIARIYRAKLYYDLGEHQSALDDCNAAIKLGMKDAELLKNDILVILAESNLQHGQYQKALNLYAQALKIKQDDFNSWYAVSEIKWRLGDKTGAEAAYAKFKEYCTPDVFYHYAPYGQFLSRI